MGAQAMMSAIHEQAMNYVYQQVLQRLLSYFTRAERTALQLLIQRLIVAAGGVEHISSFKVMIAFSGGKDSAYTVAFLRAAQLSIAGRAPGTFNLRVANMRHIGMTPAVMDNIHRTYSALFLYDDPRVELLAVDQQHIYAFEPDLPFSASAREKNRSDMLLSGHLSGGDSRTTFCNSCYLNVADFLGRVSTWGNGVDAIVSGESRKEQKQYATRIMRLVQHMGQGAGTWRQQNFASVLRNIGSVGQTYYRELYGDAPQDSGQVTRLFACPPQSVSPLFISLADLVSGRADEHWGLLTDFLGFRFVDLAFSFSESDCANPLLMAHMHGLRSQYLQDRDYADGIAEYLQLAAKLMRSKCMPVRLINQAMAAYEGQERLEERRTLAAAYALEGFGLNEAQLVCLLFAPFVGEGQGLEGFLRSCHPGMLVALPDLHKALSGLSAPDQVVQWLIDVSGLNLKGLQSLYARPRIDFADQGSLIARVRASDPDKRQIQTIDAITGEAVSTLLSGR